MISHVVWAWRDANSSCFAGFVLPWDIGNSKLQVIYSNAFDIEWAVLYEPSKDVAG
jgi:hypothetical protein